MSGGGSNTSTTTTQLPDYMNRLFKESANASLDLYKEGGAENFMPYPDSTVVDPSRATLASRDMMREQALGRDGKNITDNMSGVIRSGGFTGDQSNVLDEYDLIMRNNGFNTKMDNMYGQNQNIVRDNGTNDRMRLAMRSAENLLDTKGRTWETEKARSHYNDAMNADPAANPFMNSAIDTAIGKAADRIDLGAALKGRFRSAGHMDQLGKSIGDIAIGYQMDQYNRDMARSDHAAQQMQGVGQASLDNRLNAMNSLFGMGNSSMGNLQNAVGQGFNMAQTAMGNRMNAAGNLFNSSQYGLGNQDAAWDAMQNPAKLAGQLGDDVEAERAQRLQDDIRLYEGEQMAPYRAIEAMMAPFTGGNFGGTQTTTATAPGQNPWAQAGGNALLGYGMGGWPGALFGGLSGFF